MYDLRDDPREIPGRNLAGSNPQQAAALLALLNQHLQQVNAEQPQPAAPKGKGKGKGKAGKK